MPCRRLAVPCRRLAADPKQNKRLLEFRHPCQAKCGANDECYLDSCRMNEPKAVRIVTITNPQGVHARPADMFVKVAIKYQAKVEVVKDSERIDGKSILAILTLAATEGTELRLEATGPDADAALDELVELIANDFGENDK